MRHSGGMGEHKTKGEASRLADREAYVATKRSGTMRRAKQRASGLSVEATANEREIAARHAKVRGTHADALAQLTKWKRRGHGPGRKPKRRMGRYTGNGSES